MNYTFFGGSREGRRGGRQTEVCAPGAKNPRYASGIVLKFKISDDLLVGTFEGIIVVFVIHCNKYIVGVQQ